MSKQPANSVRPFPWRCHHCGNKQVVMGTARDYQAEIRHDGRLHRFTIPELRIPICGNCGDKVFTEDADQQINHALRLHLNLLGPQQLREGIERIGMSQKEFASCVGIAEATLSRWITETQIQSRAMDNLIRAFLAFPQVREAFHGASHDPALGSTDIVFS